MANFYHAPFFGMMPGSLRVDASSKKAGCVHLIFDVPATCSRIAQRVTLFVEDQSERAKLLALGPASDDLVTAWDAAPSIHNIDSVRVERTERGSVVVHLDDITLTFAPIAAWAAA